MITPQAFVAALGSAGVAYFAGVPDSLLKSFCAYIGDFSSERDHVIAANEGSAVGLGIGYHLATGKVPLVYLQNSGLGNTVNPLVSLADPQVYATPMLLLIGWRGQPGTRDEPQHVKQGRVTQALLETLEIPCTVIDGTEPDIAAVVAAAVDSARACGGPHALLACKGSFSGYASTRVPDANFAWTREAAIGCVVDQLDDRDLLVATTGMASRELYEYRERQGQGHERDFLTVGGMGHASQIALGLASQVPQRRVVCLDGDGAALMHLGAMAIAGTAGLRNFWHLVLNNGVHDSVGGQPTVALQIDLVKIAQAAGYDCCASCDSEAALERSIAAMQDASGPVFLEIKVNPGHREDLGRPVSTPQENKRAFMSFIQS